MVDYSKLYGALTNLYFRFYDLRMGESTTGTGRMILRHQCRKVSEILDGKYEVDFPLYESVKETVESGVEQKYALEGELFKEQFMSESVIYGDTDSTYFKTHAKNKEEAVTIADSVAEKVNSSYKEFMQKTFLCNSGFDDIIKCGREIVSDRGIFVDKKRYILHIVDKEGKATDSMKVMGLDTKKTTLPKEVTEKLNNFIELYLKGMSWDEIADKIVAYKDELRNTNDLMIIGLPKGVQKVEEYTSDFQNYGDKARLPGHVAAAIHYNQCLKAFNDKESVPIISGMKIKVFYLTKSYGKFKSIALPTDIEVIPDWFTKNFTVDIEAHIERLVDNPLQNILKAIGKKTPTRHDIFVDSAFEF
jgi:DNA polymerase elongation subunit (family B)